MKIATKIFFLFLLSIIFISAYFTFNYDFRRSTFKRAVAFINLYQYRSINVDINNKDFEKTSKKINNFINFSQKISKGKNNFWGGIYDVINLASKSAINQDDFNHLENTYLKILDIDSEIYMIHVWLARALSDNNYEKSIEHIEKALILSPANEEAYRELLRIHFNIKKNNELLLRYCKNYNFSQMGGDIEKSYMNFFNGNDMSNFSVSINNNFYKIKESYPKKIISLNKYNNYEIKLLKPLNIKSFNLISSLLPGTQIFIKNITLEKNKNLIQIPIKNINFSSEKSYLIDNSTSEFVILKGKTSDEIITFYLNNDQFITSISFDMKISRLNLTNQNICN